jgi:UDP-2,3-diacylglucosamine pyrophosphatase LpxH
VPPLDAVIISDLHLGSEVCQARQIVEFLEGVRDGRMPTRRLILNGDVFDSIDFRRLKKTHWKVLSTLRKMSDEVEVTWVCGNHDGSAEIVSHLLGVAVVDEIVVESGGKRVLFLHGHQFDRFIEKYPVSTRLADTFYRFLQRIDKSHAFAKFAKRRSKTFLRSTETIRAGSVERAARLGCQVVCCGHTHLAVENLDGPVWYYNSGCWTEKPCHYLTLADGVVTVRAFALAEPAADPAPALPDLLTA